MKCTGHLDGLMVDYSTRRQKVVLTVNEDVREQYDKLKDCEKLSIEIKKYQSKRSLDANAYFHVLVDKLADKLGISKPYCKNLMIGRYGKPFYIDDDETAEAIIKTNIPVNKMMENESIHCMPCKQKIEDGKEVVFYKLFRGSSTYNTKEMSELIDGTVYECKEQGIETLTPEELERMINSYDKKFSKGG